MKTMIMKSYKQFKLLKKIDGISRSIVWVGFSISLVGFVSFIPAMMAIVGGFQLMLISFGVGIPVMIIGSIMNEFAIYQSLRLRSRIRKSMQMIQTIQRREYEYDQALSTEERWDPGLQYDQTDLLNADSMMCLSF